MIPLRDTVVSRSPPLVVFALVGVNAAVFFCEVTLRPEVAAALIQHLSLVPARLFGGDVASGLAAAPTLVTSQFLHGGLLHVAANLWTLWIFGDNVEDRMGAWRFTTFYLLCGTTAGRVHSLAAPQSPVPTLGASGAIAGVMGAYFVLFPLARIVFLVPVLFYPLFLELPAFVYLGLWFVMQYAGGLSAMRADGAQEIAFWAHVGGFVTGVLLCGLFVRRRRRVYSDERAFEAAWKRR